VVAVKSLLGGILGESRGMNERFLMDWLIGAKAAADSTEAHLMARRIRASVASVGRADLEADPALRAILLKDIQSVDSQELALLHSWAERRMNRMMVGVPDTDRTAKLARDTSSVLQRELLALTEGKQDLRRAALDFVDYVPPKLLDGSADSDVILAAVRAARISELPEENAIELLRTMDAMLAYHGAEWDGARAMPRLRAMPPETLRQVRASYREALLNGGVEPDLMALAGRLAPVPKLDREQQFVVIRDRLLRRIDQLRWFTSNPVRATEQAQQLAISQLDYLIRIGDKKAARAMIHRKFLVVETSTLYVRRFRSMLAEAIGSKASPSEVRRLEQLVTQQEKILGGSFEEYRALRAHLDDLRAGRGTCDSNCQKIALEMDSSLGLTDLNLKSFVVSFEGMSRPSLQDVSETFFSSLVAQESSLRRAIFEEMRSTLMTLSSSVVMLNEFQRLAAKVPALHSKLRWTRGVLFFLYDTRARTIHFPQLSRIMRAQGGLPEQIQMLEQMALPPNEDLLVTFARRPDQDYRDAWNLLKKEAQVRSAALLGRMESAEKTAASLGGISAHFDHSPAVKLGALVVAGYGGYAWYQRGAAEQKQIQELQGELESLSEDLGGEGHASDPRFQSLMDKARKLQQSSP
jgi:hypothetical protein